MQPVSPPKAEVDDSPLHNAMDKNKESLKVKLMLRRPINQLVAQGIMPPLKTPPAYHEQRQKLERAKMGDLLKAKIQQRPDREELVRQHILEDVGHVDPSLAERQRQLKKCRLADALNDQLSHRPGPLELIKKNILHTEEPIERAIKEGAIEFKATSEGTATKPTHPDHYMLDEDSSSLSPPPPSVSQSNLQVVSDEAIVTSTTVSQPPPAPPPLPPVTHQVAQANSTGIVTVLLTPTAAIALPAGATTIYSSSTNGRSPQQAQTVTQSVSVPSPASSISRDKSRKKSKAKAQPKTRTIKFHEYKGPPNAQKNNNQNSTPVETSYELLLQQQQLFLQWQLEWQHKYPRLLPASQKPNSNSSSETNRGNGHVPPPPPLPEQSPPPAPPKPLTNLEDMKVSDLKAELKRRNLPVSGAKPQLIERLKPFSESAASNSSAASSSPAASSSVVSSQHTQDDSIPSVCSVSSSQTVGSSCGGAIMMDTTESPSSPSPTSPTSTATTSTTMESSVGTSTVAPDEIIRDQQRKIDMLQRQLNMQNQNTFQEPITNAKASLAAFLQQQQLNQLALQQSQQLITNNNNNNNNNNNSIKLIDAIKIEEDSQDGRTITLPNFKGTFLTNGSSDILNHIQPQECQTYLADNKHLFQIRPDTNKQMIVGECEEVKSQIVDDVLEILIKNGELPAIAAAEPVELSSLQEMDNNDLMEVDTDWLDSLMCSGSGGSGSNTNTCDPLLAVGPPSPFDLLIDEDFKLPHCGTTSTNDWDRMDFAI
ncbi:hypothetical protein O3M35_011352 [Rhynocoris fuscipes]|uniref:SAP domain-containing protein n=1 Tax=Rhynocoris fuscipes TaxID=488301 RepID=A0AAW1D158_9HEMI